MSFAEGTSTTDFNINLKQVIAILNYQIEEELNRLRGFAT